MFNDKDVLQLTETQTLIQELQRRYQNDQLDVDALSDIDPILFLHVASTAFRTVMIVGNLHAPLDHPESTGGEFEGSGMHEFISLLGSEKDTFQANMLLDAAKEYVMARYHIQDVESAVCPTEFVPVDDDDEFIEEEIDDQRYEDGETAG